MPLNVASSGATPEASRKAVDEAVRLFLATAAEHGTLKEVLEDAGYRRISREWRRPVDSVVIDLKRSSLYKILSTHGNPTLATLQEILKPLGLRISVTSGKAA